MANTEEYTRWQIKQNKDRIAVLLAQSFPAGSEEEQRRLREIEQRKGYIAGFYAELGTTEQADTDLAAQNAQRAELVRELQGIANGGGKAYSTVQGQVGAGNRRIAALASTGRGGMNASLNAANAQGQNKIAGQQAAANAQAAEKAQAQSALGQVIAQGQESNNATTAQQIADLQRQYGQTPAENPYAYGADIAGNLGQAAYSYYAQGNNETPEQKNKRLNGG